MKFKNKLIRMKCVFSIFTFYCIFSIYYLVVTPAKALAEVITFSPINKIAMTHHEYSYQMTTSTWKDPKTWRSRYRDNPDGEKITRQENIDELIEDRARNFCMQQQCGQSPCNTLIYESHELRSTSVSSPEYYFISIECSTEIHALPLIEREIFNNRLEFKEQAQMPFSLERVVELDGKVARAIVEAQENYCNEQQGITNCKLSDPEATVQGVAAYFAERRWRKMPVTIADLALFVSDDARFPLALKRYIRKDELELWLHSFENIKYKPKFHYSFPDISGIQDIPQAGRDGITWEIPDGEQGEMGDVIKIKNNNDIFYFKTQKNQQNDHRGVIEEVTSSHLNDLLNLNLIEPVTFAKNQNQIGSFHTGVPTQFKQGSKSKLNRNMQIANVLNGSDSLAILRAFDFLAHSTDRHGANLFFDPKNGNIKEIDLTGSFDPAIPLENEDYPISGGYLPTHYPQTLQASLKGLTYPKLKKTLKYLPDSAIEGVWMRAQILLVHMKTKGSLPRIKPKDLNPFVDESFSSRIAGLKRQGKGTNMLSGFIKNSK